MYLSVPKEFAPKSIKFAKKEKKINRGTITQLLIDSGVLVYPIGVWEAHSYITAFIN